MELLEKGLLSSFYHDIMYKFRLRGWYQAKDFKKFFKKCVDKVNAKWYYIQVAAEAVGKNLENWTIPKMNVRVESQDLTESINFEKSKKTSQYFKRANHGSSK